MTEPGLFDVDPWREAMLSDVKPGDWFSWPDRRHWNRLLKVSVTERGNLLYDHTGALRGNTMTGGGACGDRPVRIYNGTPPDSERAA